MKNAAIILVAFAFASVTACKGEEEKQKEREALKAELKSDLEAQQKAHDDDIAKQAAAKADSDAKLAEMKKMSDRDDVVANPSKYLVDKGLQFFDKGLVNHYRSVQSLTVLNKSPYAVTELRADVSWFGGGKTGGVLGSTPIVLKGSIAPGDTKTFSTKDGTLTSGTIEGNGSVHIVKWTHVNLVDVK